MPVFHGSMAGRPGWCELEEFRIVRVEARRNWQWSARCDSNKLVVVSGKCDLRLPSGSMTIGPGKFADATFGDYAVTNDEECILVILGGHWGDDHGGAGVFTVEAGTGRGDVGDPVDYPKHTDFDRHFHDCDEYWILVSGSGTAMSEGTLYEVGPGDCVATAMGDHHDFPWVIEPVRAVFFETTMRGQKRRGHLWEHTHGAARTHER